MDGVISQFTLNKDAVDKIKHTMQSEMVKGLKEDGGSTLKMLPTYVHGIPDGTERGDFLALDLGGTNFRVLKITLNNRKYEQIEKKVHLPDEVITDTQETLFGYLANVVAEFMQEHSIRAVLPLGFTFSFPVKQLSLTSGLLIAWTKKFTASGTAGQDVVKLLKAAFDKRKASGTMCLKHTSVYLCN